MGKEGSQGGREAVGERGRWRPGREQEGAGMSRWKERKREREGGSERMSGRK